MADNNVESMTAGGAIPKYSVVSVSSGKVVVTTGADDIPFGIAQDAAADDGDVIPVLTSGNTKVLAADGSVAVGELLSGVASGRADTNAGANNTYYFGTALEASGAAGDQIKCTFDGAVLQDDDGA